MSTEIATVKEELCKEATKTINANRGRMQPMELASCHIRGGKHICVSYFKCSGAANLPQRKLKAEEIAKDKTEDEKLQVFKMRHGFHSFSP